MKDYFLKLRRAIRLTHLQFQGGGYERGRTIKFKILFAGILVLSMRLFFYVDFDARAHAGQFLSSQNKPANIFDPIGKMKAEAEEKKAMRYRETPVSADEKNVKSEVNNEAIEVDEDLNKFQKTKRKTTDYPVGQPLENQVKKTEVFDPIGKLKTEAKEKNDRQSKKLFLCTNSKFVDLSAIKIVTDNSEKYRDLVAGHPIEEMVDFIAKRDHETASYLVAIAKKESDWGTHAPQKNGRDCFNYWGFKGSYNLTDSGYSCFDSPEQAISMVGDKISDLINKKVDTPERMVVWKCGSSCAGHDPVAVKKWITDVGSYHAKLSS